MLQTLEKKLLLAQELEKLLRLQESLEYQKKVEYPLPARAPCDLAFCEISRAFEVWAVTTWRLCLCSRLTFFLGIAINRRWTRPRMRPC